MLALLKSIFKKKALFPLEGRGYYESFTEYLAANPTNTYKLIYPSHVITRKEPVTVGNLHWKFPQSYEQSTPDAFCTELRDAYVYGDTGSVITPDLKVIGGISVEMRREISNHTFLTNQLITMPRKLNGNIAVLASDAGKTFFHWLFDVLPRLDLIQRADIPLEKIDTFIVNTLTGRFQTDTLQLLGIPRSKIIHSHKNFFIQGENLIIPSLTGHSGVMPAWTCSYLRENLLAKAGKPKKDSPERIYISRIKAGNLRSVTNEKDVLKVLKPLGFKRVILEDLSMIDQIRLFAGAKVVIGPHGAGMSNTVFCNKGTKMIEFFSKNYVNPCFYYLANHLELDYAYLLGEGKDPPEFVCPAMGRENITVNLGQLKDLLYRFL